MMTTLRSKGATITDNLKLPKRVVTSARECIATLDTAYAEIMVRLPRSARPLESESPGEQQATQSGPGSDDAI